LREKIVVQMQAAAEQKEQLPCCMNDKKTSKKSMLREKTAVDINYLECSTAKRKRKAYNLLIMAKPSKRSASFNSRAMFSKKTAVKDNILHKLSSNAAQQKKQKRACQTTHGPSKLSRPSQERSSTALDTAIKPILAVNHALAHRS